MVRTFFHILVRAAWVLFLALPALQAAPASDLIVEVLPRDPHPGEALWIRMQATEGIRSVRGSIGDQKVDFVPAPDSRGWVGLAGLDLDLKPGVHLFAYRVRFAGGGRLQGTYGVRVLVKTFPVERITVNEKYVHLSAEDLTRYRRERKLLGAIYGKQSDDIFWTGGFSVPVEGERGSRFGLRRIVNGEPRSPHSGADLRAGRGTPVAASAAGRVVLASDLFFSGNTVILDHGGGLYTLYAHLDRMLVRPDQVVAPGEILGLAGSTGRVTGPHLHWGAKLNGARIDPFSLLSLPLLPAQGREDPDTR